MHKHLYGGLILGVNPLYMLFWFFKLFPMVGKGLIGSRLCSSLVLPPSTPGLPGHQPLARSTVQVPHGQFSRTRDLTDLHSNDSTVIVARPSKPSSKCFEERLGQG